MTARPQGPLAQLFTAYRHGDINRRAFVQGATSLGIAGGLIASLANSPLVAAQSATAEATPVDNAAWASSGGARPESGTENQTRGEGGELKIIQWQAPTLLNPSVSTGEKDSLAAQLISEPLLITLGDASLAPILAAEVPTIENGQLAEDLTSVTYTLREGVLWSDGEPFTAEDVVFTWQWHINPDNGSFAAGNWDIVESVEAIDDLTVTFTFTAPNPIWITTAGNTAIFPKHILEAGGQEVNDAFALSPIGTGPFVVETFTPGDQVTYIANENYREPNKPYFARVLLKGGGDAASAARSVLQTGDFDFAWWLQVEPEVLESRTSEDGPGTLIVSNSATLEEIDINHSDPRTEVDGQTSQKDTPNPFWADLKVRQALALAIDREDLIGKFYLPGNKAVANVVVGNPVLESPNNPLEFNPEKAAQLLDEAGWILDGDVRKKDGVEFSITYASSTNQVRQKVQQVIKARLEEVGIKVELVQVDAGTFFDGSPGNTQNITHFPWDLQQYGRTITDVVPLNFLRAWYAGENGENIAQQENSWSGRNYTRWQNAEYDALLDEATTNGDAERVTEIIIQANDILVQDYGILPLFQNGQNTAFAKTLNEVNFGFTPFAYQYWNIANWNRIAE